MSVNLPAVTGADLMQYKFISDPWVVCTHLHFCQEHACSPYSLHHLRFTPYLCLPQSHNIDTFCPVSHVSLTITILASVMFSQRKQLFLSILPETYHLGTQTSCIKSRKCFFLQQGTVTYFKCQRTVSSVVTKLWKQKGHNEALLRNYFGIFLLMENPTAATRIF